MTTQQKYLPFAFTLATALLFFVFSVAYAQASTEQSGYRWFSNIDSTDVGAPLASQNSATLAPTVGSELRLRALLHADTVLDPDSKFTLQVAQQGGDAQCDLSFVDEAYSNVSTNSLSLGSDWSVSTPNAPWSARGGHGLTVFDNKLWVLGGSDADADAQNDVWYSSDGSHWTAATTSAAWGPRHNHAVAVFDNKLWVLGGTDEVGNALNDVWYSSDGTNWTEATNSAGWVARGGHTALAFNNKLWVLGGSVGAFGSGTCPGGNANLCRDVWSSTDGVTWNLETDSAGWDARTSHQTLVFNNELWVLGGFAGIRDNDVWHSPDGILWTQATADADWAARSAHGATVADGKMWVLGGVVGPSVNDVWYSTDGVNWAQATASANWSPRLPGEAAFFNDSLWVLGGTSGTEINNDVWHSRSTPTALTFTDNPTPHSGALVTANSNDPTHGEHTVVSQTYTENNPFTGVTTTPTNTDGLWDFALLNNNTATSSTYCFRIVHTDGTLLSDYLVLPELTTDAGAVLNARPVADAGGPYVTEENTPITLNGLGSFDDDGDPLTYAWDFGDTTSGVGATPTHTYATIGEYVVTLTVSDGIDTSVSDNTVVTVTDSISVTKAQYQPPKEELSVEAISSHGGEVVLTVWDSLGTAGTQIGVMEYNARKDVYTFSVKNIPNPSTIVVTSSFGGESTASVEQKGGGGNKNGLR